MHIYTHTKAQVLQSPKDDGQYNTEGQSIYLVCAIVRVLCGTTDKLGLSHYDSPKDQEHDTIV